MSLKLLQKEQLKKKKKNKQTAEASGDLIVNKIEDNIKRTATQRALGTASQAEEKSIENQKKNTYNLKKGNKPLMKLD